MLQSSLILKAKSGGRGAAFGGCILPLARLARTLCVCFENAFWCAWRAMGEWRTHPPSASLASSLSNALYHEGESYTRMRFQFRAGEGLNTRRSELHRMHATASDPPPVHIAIIPLPNHRSTPARCTYRLPNSSCKVHSRRCPQICAKNRWNFVFCTFWMEKMLSSCVGFNKPLKKSHFFNQSQIISSFISEIGDLGEIVFFDLLNKKRNILIFSRVTCAFFALNAKVTYWCIWKKPWNLNLEFYNLVRKNFKISEIS